MFVLCLFKSVNRKVLFLKMKLSNYFLITENVVFFIRKKRPGIMFHAVSLRVCKHDYPCCRFLCFAFSGGWVLLVNVWLEKKQSFYSIRLFLPTEIQYCVRREVPEAIDKEKLAQEKADWLARRQGHTKVRASVLLWRLNQVSCEHIELYLPSPKKMLTFYWNHFHSLFTNTNEHFFCVTY